MNNVGGREVGYPWAEVLNLRPLLSSCLVFGVSPSLIKLL